MCFTWSRLCCVHVWFENLLHVRTFVKNKSHISGKMNLKWAYIIKESDYYLYWQLFYDETIIFFTKKWCIMRESHSAMGGNKAWLIKKKACLKWCVMHERTTHVEEDWKSSVFFIWEILWLLSSSFNIFCQGLWIII